MLHHKLFEDLFFFKRKLVLHFVWSEGTTQLRGMTGILEPGCHWSGKSLQLDDLEVLVQILQYTRWPAHYPSSQKEFYCLVRRMLRPLGAALSTGSLRPLPAVWKIERQVLFERQLHPTSWNAPRIDSNHIPAAIMARIQKTILVASQSKQMIGKVVKSKHFPLVAYIVTRVW